MTSTTSTPLEHALQRHGDDLYRLALFLTSDEAHAAAALHSAVPRLIDRPPAALDEPAMIAALVAALPAERRRLRRQRPAWSRLPAERAEAPLLAALAQLPRQQRLVLGLLLLRGFDVAQAASTLGADEAGIRALGRDALLALAPHVRPGFAPGALAADSAPEACRPTRLALALGGDLAHTDSMTRGHLALCAACRAAEQDWQRLTMTVENALRGALRDTTMPEYLAGELRAITARTPGQPRHSLLASQRGRLALVALAVIAVIAVLVLPGRRPPATISTGATVGTPVVLAPRALVERALGQLYAPPAGAGVWHGHWEIRWNFVGGSYATLNAEAWLDTASSRHRVQLVHANGGGPFEFELADQGGNLWYATTQNYALSLYPSLLDRNQLRTRLQIKPDQARQMLRERFASGAWDLAGVYLRQAQAAPELHSWGRQRTPDGATLEVISFDGFSPLAAGTPDTAGVPTTILLAFDVQSGALYEVRELIGPEGGERISRTTWRFVAGEWLTATQDIERSFDQQRAWNGTGDFGELQAGYADPALPLVPVRRVLSLASTLQQNQALRLLAAAPPGTERAVLLAADDGQSLWTVYLAPGRRLVIRTLTGPDSAQVELQPTSGEAITLGEQLLVLRPINGLSYQARLSYRGPFDQQQQVTIGAIGYTRAELLDLFRGFGPPTAEAFRAQASLFADPQADDPAAFEALLGALAGPAQLQPGAARHFVERTFTRHNPRPDAFPDPYHLPPYGGRPEQLEIENWVRAGSAGIETTATERDASGTIYGRQYLGPSTVWYYDAPAQQSRQLPTHDLGLINRINLDQGIVFDLLARGGSRLVTLTDGTRAISSTRPLIETRAFSQLAQQQSDPDAGGPYVADLYIDTAITTLVSLGPDGRPRRIETWSSGSPSVSGAASSERVLLEGWELVSDEQLPADRIPAGTFDAKPPETLTFTDYTLPPQSYQPNTNLDTLSITDGLQLLRTPLFVLPPDLVTKAPLLEAGDPANLHREIWQNDPFQAALERGLAIRVTNWLSTTEQPLLQTAIYQGDAQTFGGYLRTQSAWRWGWQHSEPFPLVLGQRRVDGWRLTTTSGAVWTLFEIDGTLLAAQTDHTEQVAALARLQPYPVR